MRPHRHVYKYIDILLYIYVSACYYSIYIFSFCLSFGLYYCIPVSNTRIIPICRPDFTSAVRVVKKYCCPLGRVRKFTSLSVSARFGHIFMCYQYWGNKIKVVNIRGEYYIWCQHTGYLSVVVTADTLITSIFLVM